MSLADTVKDENEKAELKVIENNNNNNNHNNKSNNNNNNNNNNKSEIIPKSKVSSNLKQITSVKDNKDKDNSNEKPTLLSVNVKIKNTPEINILQSLHSMLNNMDIKISKE
jgi:hypothetical protein